MSNHPPNQPVRYAIAGTGGFGSCRRAMLRNSGAFEIVGALDPNDAAIANTNKEEGKNVRRYQSMEELCSDPAVEAVFISTPAHLHTSQAWQAARAGKAIFTEKPLGHDLEDCRKLVDYCEANNIPHGHGFTVPPNPLWMEVKRILETGLLGTLVSVSVASMSTGGFYFPPTNWRFRRAENPGGQLFQCGIHKIDMLRRLFGDGTWLAGYVRSDMTPAETDDGYVLLGQFGGVPVTMHSHYVASYRHAMEIYGTEGDLFITEHPEKLEYKKTDLGGGVEPVFDWTEKIPRHDGTGDFMRDFAGAVREQRQPLLSGRDGLKALELVFEAIRIAKPLPPQKMTSSVPCLPECAPPASAAVCLPSLAHP
jgi:UDP-N-acetyl-2-amino-2-deoxyglucuronate dehydrogenase